MSFQKYQVSVMANPPKKTYKYTEIPVIQVPRSILPLGIPDINILEKMPYEIVMTKIMLPMKAEDILSLCEVSTKINKICQNEYFWMIKTKYDFGEDIMLSSGDTWRNLYFNKLVPKRLLRQNVERGDIEGIKQALEDESKARYVLDRELIIALKNENLEVVELLLSYHPTPQNVESTLSVLCAIAQIDGGIRIYRIFREYWDLVTIDEINPLHFKELMNCLIEGKNGMILRQVYHDFLNIYGSYPQYREFTEPTQYLNLVYNRGYQKMAFIIQRTYKEYNTNLRRIRKRY